MERGEKKGFKHEIHGLRVVDKLTNHGAGLNLTYEVRDGIISHCGEHFEQQIIPDRKKNLYTLESINSRNTYPSTLEGCLVRMVDRIAYLGRDLEDGIKAGMASLDNVPREVTSLLGTDNGEIIGVFVHDTIANSADIDAIKLSDAIFDAMNKLKEFNYSHIYLHPRVERKAKKGEHVLEQLFIRLINILQKSDRGRNKHYVNDIINDAPSVAVFFDFIKNSNYNEETPVSRIVSDYIAGMTDIFAQRSYLQLFLPSPVI
jgi:dGTPase